MTIFLDIDTQNDFLFPGGALYVPGAEAVVDNVASLNRRAAELGSPVISTTDAHAPDDPEFADWPPHCIVGTEGQRKPEETLLADRLSVASDPGFTVNRIPAQLILEKQFFDCFTNPNLPGILDRLHADRYVIYGVVPEICVQHAARGLFAYLKDRGRSTKVELVTDAVMQLDEAARDTFFGKFKAAGGELTSAPSVITSVESVAGR